LVCWGFAWLSAAAVVAILSSGVAVRLWPQVSYITGLTWYFQVLTVLAPLTLVKVYLPKAFRNNAPSADSRFRNFGRGQVDCVTVEDHYVRVHCGASSRLLYGTFRDAVAQLRNQDGL